MSAPVMATIAMASMKKCEFSLHVNIGGWTNNETSAAKRVGEALGQI